MVAETQTRKSDLLTAESRAQIDGWIARYPADQKKSAVLSALQIAQQQNGLSALQVAQQQNGGWVSSELMDAVADYLDMQPIEVYEVSTFYSMIEIEPVGRNMVAVCTNLSCALLNMLKRNSRSSSGKQQQMVVSP